MAVHSELEGVSNETRSLNDSAPYLRLNVSKSSHLRRVELHAHARLHAHVSDLYLLFYEAYFSRLAT